ncbi:Hypothetical_protein [Hexamita inflata]|uniref:Hypothetical_protein n=1 Tax=Hexamita inflata TaxID=28002 RepID=A0ABP1JRU9_9EUKA
MNYWHLSQKLSSTHLKHAQLNSLTNLNYFKQQQNQVLTKMGSELKSLSSMSLSNKSTFDSQLSDYSSEQMKNRFEELRISVSDDQAIFINECDFYCEDLEITPLRKLIDL